MHRPEPPARVAAVLAAALLLGAPSALGEDQPKPGEALGPSHVQLQLARSHQYSDRFAVQFVTASPDGREVAALARLSGSEPRAWDVRDGRTLELPPTSPETTVLAYSADGRWLATAIRAQVLSGNPGGIDILDLKSGRAAHRLRGGQDSSDLAFSPDGSVLVAATSEGLVAWELAEGSPKQVLSVPNGADSVSFVSGNEVIVGSAGGQLLLRASLQDGRVRESWEGRGGSAACVSPSGRLVAMGGEDALRILDLWDGGAAQVVPLDSAVTALDWSASGRVLAVGTSSGSLLVFTAQGERGLPEDPEPTRLAGQSGGGSDAGRSREAERRGEREDRQVDRGRDAPLARPGAGLERGRDSERAGPSRSEARGAGLGGVAAVEEPPEIRADVRLIVMEWIGSDPRESRELERSLKDNIKRLEPCWKREARKGNSVLGELILPLSVSANGEGRTIKDPVSDSIGNAKLLECLQDKLQANLFPAGLGTLDVELTLTLSEEAR